MLIDRQPLEKRIIAQIEHAEIGGFIGGFIEFEPRPLEITGLSNTDSEGVGAVASENIGDWVLGSVRLLSTNSGMQIL